MAEYTPELDEQVLEAIRRRIAEQEAQQVSAARGDATARGLTGSTFEATRVGLANKAAQTAQTDAMVQMALERANMAREERLIREGQQYSSMEAEKNRMFQAGQSAEENQNQLMSSGIEGITGLGGQLGSMYLAKKLGLFGTGAAGVGGGGGAVPGVAGAAGASGGVPIGGAGAAGAGGGGGFGAAAGWGAGISAGLLGGGYGGQTLGNALFKNKRTEKASRKGASAGAGIGTAIGSIYGPLGSAVGGILGGGVGSLAGGATTAITGGKAVTLRNTLTGGKAATVQNIVKAPLTIAKNIGKKIFCFHPDTLIEMADGSELPIWKISLGDLTKGGVVESVRFANAADRFSYNGVIVTGSHAVKENDKWIRVEDSDDALPVAGKGIVFSLVTSLHRVYANGIEFSDEHETDDYEELSIHESLEALNNGK